MRCEARKGVCQDFAHIMIALVRQLGIPCRYVSGYLFHQRRQSAIVRPTARPTPGWKRCCPTSAGSASIRPTTSSPAIATSASPSVATTPTCRRHAASSRGRARCGASWPWPCRWAPRLSRKACRLTKCRRTCRGYHAKCRRRCPGLTCLSNSNSTAAAVAISGCAPVRPRAPRPLQLDAGYL